MNISVAMAVYNGEKYLKKQIDSILEQLIEEDELVVSYNDSNDNTMIILKEYMIDKRVKVFSCEEKDVIKNFENAIKECTNEIIFLSDQDDIWFPNKKEYIIDYFLDNKVMAVCHDKEYVNDEMRIVYIAKKRFKKNEIYLKLYNILYKNCIQGSCLAFRKSILKGVLPFPENIPMHDSWIGLVAIKYGELLYLNKKLLYYRQHDNNVTSLKHGNLFLMLYQRYELLANYLKIGRSNK